MALQEHRHWRRPSAWWADRRNGRTTSDAAGCPAWPNAAGRPEQAEVRQLQIGVEFGSYRGQIKTQQAVEQGLATHTSAPGWDRLATDPGLGNRGENTSWPGWPDSVNKSLIGIDQPPLRMLAYKLGNEQQAVCGNSHQRSAPSIIGRRFGKQAIDHLKSTGPLTCCRHSMRSLSTKSAGGASATGC